MVFQVISLIGLLCFGIERFLDSTTCSVWSGTFWMPFSINHIPLGPTSKEISSCLTFTQLVRPLPRSDIECIFKSSGSSRCSQHLSVLRLLWQTVYMKQIRQMCAQLAVKYFVGFKLCCSHLLTFIHFAKYVFHKHVTLVMLAPRSCMKLKGYSNQK